MKKFILSLAATFMAVSAMAHVLTITLSDGTQKVITSSELRSIDINGQMVTAVAYDGTTIEGLDNATAQTIVMDGTARITEIISKTVSYEYSGITLGSRDCKLVNYVYPSVDPSGNPITLSGVIIIPDDIYYGTAANDGILLYNHYTLGDKKEAPTRGVFSDEAVLLGSFLKPNYIMVESDFYGFGATERFPQAYLFGQTNAKASVDAYYAALDLLEQLQIDKGKYLFNLGYSSGGFDVMATQKEVDNNHRGIIKIDKTYSGGGPCDLPIVYRDYVNVDHIKYLCAVPLMITAYNECGKMGLDYSTVFQSPLAENIYDWVIDMNYDTWTINGKIGEGTLVSEMLQPAYCDLESPEAQRFLEMFAEYSNDNAWEPDPDDKFFLLHSRDDEYVTFAAARAMADYLTARGFEKSIVPGRTNFQTNLVLKKLGHIYAMLVWIVQTSADIKAWPIIHATPEAEAAFYDLVSQDISVTQILDNLNALGINANDVITLLNRLIGEQGGQGIDINVLADLLAYLDITLEEFNEMCDDSGIDMQEALNQLVVWLQTHPGTLPNDENAEIVMRRVATQEGDEQNIIRVYEQQLMNHYRELGLIK